MKNISTQNDNKKRTTLLMILAFVLLSFGNAFGQTPPENNTDINTTIESNIAQTNASKQMTESNVSNMNFVLWFMGSKQDPNAKALPAGINTKKQFMTSGMEPNRLLIKAFLKKAVNFESATA